MDNRRIYEQLREVEIALRSAYNRFEQICEPDLVESEIYLIKCLEAKRSHLIKEARMSDESGTAQPMPARPAPVQAASDSRAAAAEIEIGAEKIST